jgi:hypothetical protein
MEIKMTGGIFLIKDDDQLVKMEEASYDSEALLQELLEKYPDLLAGDQINQVSPRKWLLVSREMQISSEEIEGRWSLDHLFLDQDGIPTLVEVKRSSDTRLRREVVGQMLDYAANAVTYWSIETIKSSFEGYCEQNRMVPDNLLIDLIGEDSDPEEFWQKVKTNLQIGKIRMVFVADNIPHELKRIVEFLNEQMDPAEVLAIEVKQYIGDKVKSLVPRVVGQTEQAINKKSIGKSPKRKWDEESFFRELKLGSPESEKIARKIYHWTKEKMPEFWWGEGVRYGSFIPGFNHNGIWHQIIGLWTNGYIELQFQYMKKQPPFDNIEKRKALLGKFNQALNTQISEENVNLRPPISFGDIKNEEMLNRFFGVLEWFIDEVKKS